MALFLHQLLFSEGLRSAGHVEIRLTDLLPVV